MSNSWLGFRRASRPNKKFAAARSRHRTLGIESLDSRLCLSASPLATPDDVAMIPAGSATPLTTRGPTGMTPAEIRGAYGFNSVTFSGGTAATGAGETIAIVDAYDDPDIANDLHQFDLAFGLPDPTFTKENQNGGSSLPAANKSWSTEIALDVEWAHAIAPGANILLVEANSSSFSNLLTAVNTARNTTGVVAVSMSWGGSEFSGETADDSDFTTPAGHAGEAFFVSSGDDGAPASYPATSPNVVSVGGTTLNLSGSNYGSESAWSGSGGGLSSYESQPSYQKGIVTQSSTARANPDVSYDANPSTGFPVYDSYNNGTADPWGQWGGTSDAAPQWAALTAIADQGRAINGLGSLNGASQLLPALYQLPASDFHDVTTGSSTGSPKESAAVGYDLATGRGTPVANLLIPALAAWTGSSQTTTAPAAPANFTASAASSTQVNVSWSLSSGATSYNLYYETGSSSPVLAGTYGASTTSATVSGLTAGATYSFEIVAVNSAGTGASSWVPVTLSSNGSLAAPGNFAVKATSSTQATLTWTASQGATSYLVYWWNGRRAVELGSVSSGTTSVSVRGLTPGSTDKFYVTAVNSTSSASTGWVSVFMPSANVLTAPQNVMVTATSSSSGTLSWSVSAGASGYEIYYWNGVQAVLLGTVGAGTTSVNISGLSAGSTSQFAVVAYNSSTTAASSWASLVTPSATTHHATASASQLTDYVFYYSPAEKRWAWS